MSELQKTNNMTISYFETYTNVFSYLFQETKLI